MHEAISLAQQLVRLASVSPMGKPLPEGSLIHGESRVSDFLETWGREHQLRVKRQQVAPSRDNVVFWLPGELPGVVLWEVHQDTVPVEGMVIEPFGGELREGRLYGRGACDVKGTMACMLAALRELSATSPQQRSSLMLACTVDEEQGGAGAIALPQIWESGELPRPDIAIVAEPTELDVVVAHKGVLRWTCRTRGRAAHSSAPHEGDSAIYRMAAVVSALQRYQDEVLARRPAHPLLGRPTLSVGTIRGGVGVNLVPDACEIEIDRRLLPGESPAAAQGDVTHFLASLDLAGEKIVHEPPYLESRGLSDEANGEMAERLARAARSVGAAGRKIGVPFGTDASRLAPHVPCVVFGAGSIAQAHTIDEWIAVKQLEDTTTALVNFMLAAH
ncbi:MAG: M20 family metallopeptidase [Planctomycetales bacterium]|nr:M20 family metallopeptidase [Planctomycetales bacterium]